MTTWIYANASPEKVDDLLVEAAEVNSCPERNKYVLLLLDEMHVREDLVYYKHTGELIGSTNLGDINDQLGTYEMALIGGEHPLFLAKSVLVFMLWELFNKLQIPYA